MSNTTCSLYPNNEEEVLIFHHVKRLLTNLTNLEITIKDKEIFNRRTLEGFERSKMLCCRAHFKGTSFEGVVKGYVLILLSKFAGGNFEISLGEPFIFRE